jgi:hypothetical protein
MEKIITSFTKGRGKKTLATPNRKNASKMPHHHLSIFIMGISLFNEWRYGFSAPSLFPSPPNRGRGRGEGM